MEREKFSSLLPLLGFLGQIQASSLCPQWVSWGTLRAALTGTMWVGDPAAFTGRGTGPPRGTGESRIHLPHKCARPPGKKMCQGCSIQVGKILSKQINEVISGTNKCFKQGKASQKQGKRMLRWGEWC